MDYNHEPCFRCEKPVRLDRPHWSVRMSTSGEVVAADAELAPEHDQGWFVVGPECRRNYPEAVRAEGYVI